MSFVSEASEEGVRSVRWVCLGQRICQTCPERGDGICRSDRGILDSRDICRCSLKYLWESSMALEALLAVVSHTLIPLRRPRIVTSPAKSGRGVYLCVPTPNPMSFGKDTGPGISLRGRSFGLSVTTILFPFPMAKLAVDAEMREKVEEQEDHHVENLAYEGGDTAPQLHWRTYVALASMCLLQFVMLFALLGPPVAVSTVDALKRDETNDAVQAFLHWCCRRWHNSAELDPEHPYALASSIGPAHCIGVRPVPGKEVDPDR